MLVAGGAALEREATRILDKLGHGPFVFNLGHGVVPQTPPEHVAQLVEIVRNWKPHHGHLVKIAIILFNLGGPDSLEAVQPFLRNLFGDPAILRVPGFIRGPLASFLARRRTPTARAIYDKIGGSSPILGQTEAQARALEEALGTRARMARLCLHALLASDDRSRGALGRALRARPHRAAAALSAVLDDDDGIVVQGVERHGEVQGADHRS